MSGEPCAGPKLARRIAANIAKLPELLLITHGTAQSLAGRSICFRRLGSSVSNSFEFLAGPSPNSADIRNHARCRRREHRGNDSLGLLSFRNEQEIGFAGCKVKSDYFTTCFFNQLPHSRFAILRFG